MNTRTVIAIPAHNEAERLFACLKALTAQRAAPSAEIVVLLNNCGDASEAVQGGGKPGHWSVDVVLTRAE